MPAHDLTLSPPPGDGRRCAELLLDTLRGHRGVLGVEFSPADGNIRLRYDPELIQADEVEEAARHLGLNLEGGVDRCQWALKGVRCRDCANALEREVERVPGVRWAQANSAAGTLGFEVAGGPIAAREVEKRVRHFGYRVSGEQDADRPWYRHPMVVGALLCGVLVAAGFVARGLKAPRDVWVALFALAYLPGGAQGLIEAWASLRNRIFDVNFLMLLSAAGAACIGGWTEGAMLLFLFSLSNAMQYFALERTRHAIRALMQLKPETATVVRDGVEVVLPAEQIRPGDRVRVKPGERLAADGEVVEGSTWVDESAMTGESRPVQKTLGSGVYAGTINGSGAFEFTVTREAGETRLSRIIQLVEEAQGDKAPTQRFIDRFGQYYAFAVVIAVALTATLLPTVFHWEWHEAFYRAMVALVVASPCALVISTPATILSGIAAAARRGILFKGGGHLEAVGRVRAVAFDKTGTLTAGQPALTDVIPAAGRSAGDLLELAAAAEARSEHPLGEAIVKGLQGRAPAVATEVRGLPGRGVEATVNGIRVRVGSMRLMEELGIEVPEAQRSDMARLEGEGKTVMVAADERLLGLLAVSDEPRPDARDMVLALRRAGVRHVVMLTGDHREAAVAIARRIGIEEVRAGLLPEDKVRVLRELKRHYGVVAMVGDGVNDAPALATADVGIAMGGRGTDVALETADVVLMSDSLARLPELISLGRRASRVVKQNVILSVGVMLVLIALNSFGKIILPVGVLGHEGSTVIVVLNGLRLLRVKGGRT